MQGSGELGLSPPRALVPGWSHGQGLVFRAGTCIWVQLVVHGFGKCFGFSAWGTPRCSLKYLNFWHLVLEIICASKYCSEYSRGWRTRGKYCAVFWKTHYNNEGHDCGIQSCLCAGQTVVPLMKHIFVVSFFFFFLLNVFLGTVSLLFNRNALGFDFLLWLWAYLFCHDGRSIWCNYKSYWGKKV